MTRPALSATRGIAIIDFLAAYPERPFTLSEISNAVEINVASCHSVLNALVNGGYLSRDLSQKTYLLGPALVAVGKAALQDQPLLELAQNAAERLASELEQPVVITAPVNDEILAIDSVAAPSGKMPRMLAGQRMPHIPPVGALFLAWSSQAARDEWLARLTPSADAELISVWQNDLTLIRERGFQLSVRAPVLVDFATHMKEMAEIRRIPKIKVEIRNVINSLDHRIYQPEFIDLDEEYEVVQISAPIFDQSGSARFGIHLTEFSRKLSGSTITSYANCLMQTCLEISRAERQSELGHLR